MHFKSRVGWFANLIAMLIAFIHGIKMKIYNFFMGLVPNIPERLKGLVKMVIYLIILPFTLLGMIFFLIKKMMQAPGGIIGIIISLCISVFILMFMFLFEVIGILLSPLLNKIADSMIDKHLIKKMVIGSFVFDNSFTGGILLENAMVENVSFETFKNLLGQEKLYIIVKEGNLESSFIDKPK